ncbi:hypothetical protein [Hymenobacter arizonensis]|uniref:Uncharacterized protein n=1 Tax=Hymenobacter arizonensis TaxID=1227077 RepID=A0A1I5XHD5_HYMAR|nr:hypothetical protein [Hymenobacter arizonensis]SFQ31389.1 hypothetical protein SAMN04515668_1851 [Hymenobacter arizonensis]
MESTAPNVFDKARLGLWVSLEKHLATVYAAEGAFRQAVAFTDTFPFAASSATTAQLADYDRERRALRDLFTDETAQLDTLTKAIRTKQYAEAEKKQLYLLLLGYIDIAASVFELLESHASTPRPKDDELVETQARFERVKRFARLNVKGISGLLTLP